MTPARHTESFSYYYFNYFRHVAMLHKFAGLLVGAPFCGAPVRPNMLNMPKSASADLQSVHGFRCYDNSAEHEMSACACTHSMPGCVAQL